MGAKNVAKAKECRNKDKDKNVFLHLKSSRLTGSNPPWQNQSVLALACLCSCVNLKQLVSTILLPLMERIRFIPLSFCNPFQ